MKTITTEEIGLQYVCMNNVRAFNRGRDRRFFIKTFGCQQNEADSERLAGMASEMGYIPTEIPEEADLILINTCAVREHAELRALSATGHFKHLKEKNPGLVIGICGCMVTQESRMNDIRRSYPYVDLLIGTGMLYRFPEILLSHLQNDKRIFLIDETEGNIAEGLPVRRESKIKAWVSVMYGCDNFCSYCVVPHVRGRERSRERENILAEVNELISGGCREITLLGQNVNSYGKDLQKGYDFADLVREISSIDGDFVLRFMTSHPKDASRKLIDTMAASDKCARQFHLPLQSGSRRILDAMNRRYTPDGYYEMIEYIREKLPGAAISSDIIVGFPGETDGDFEKTLEMLNRIKFDMVYSFIYSPRPLTPAANYANQIPPEIKSIRMERLLKLQNEISLGINMASIGSIQRVLLEGVSKSSPETLSGRADSNKLVHLPRTTEAEAKIGGFIKVKITRAEPYSLFGEISE